MMSQLRLLTIEVITILLSNVSFQFLLALEILYIAMLADDDLVPFLRAIVIR